MFWFLRDLKLNIKISILEESVLITAAACGARHVWQKTINTTKLAQRGGPAAGCPDLDHIARGLPTAPVGRRMRPSRSSCQENLNVMRHARPPR